MRARTRPHHDAHRDCALRIYLYIFPLSSLFLPRTLVLDNVFLFSSSSSGGASYSAGSGTKRDLPAEAV